MEAGTVRLRLTPAMRTTAAFRTPLASRMVARPIADQGTTTPKISYDSPLADSPATGAEKPAAAETPWLLYAGIAAAVGVVGYVVYTKKFAKKGRGR